MADFHSRPILFVQRKMNKPHSIQKLHTGVPKFLTKISVNWLALQRLKELAEPGCELLLFNEASI